MNLLLVLAYWGQHRFVRARQEMMRVIRLAEPERMIRPFLDCGDQIIPLLIDILHMKKPSPREREILQLLDEGLDNKVLARRLIAYR